VGDTSRPAPDPRLERLIAALGVEEGSRAYVEELRWPDGVWCPRCGSDETRWLVTREKHHCRACAYQFRVTAGTVLHDSHVSIARWLVAVQLIVESEHGFPANQLQAVIGGNYRTAWFVGHRIRAAMTHALPDLTMPLAYVVETEAGIPSSIESGLESVGSATGWASVPRRLIAGAYHRPSPKYMTAYRDETRWRTANVGDSNAFRKTVGALLATEPLPYRELVHRSSL
jgi:transposase-like protein